MLWRDKGEPDTGWVNGEEDRRGVWRRNYEKGWLTLNVVRDQLQQITTYKGKGMGMRKVNKIYEDESKNNKRENIG